MRALLSCLTIGLLLSAATAGTAAVTTARNDGGELPFTPAGSAALPISLDDAPALIGYFVHDARYVPDSVLQGEDGLLYRLSRKIITGDQQLKILTDASNTPVLAHMTQRLGDNATINALLFAQATDKLIRGTRPLWAEGPGQAEAAIKQAVKGFAPGAPDRDIRLTLPDGGVATLRLRASQGLASMDIVPRVPNLQDFTETEMRRMLNGNTVIMAVTEGGTRTGFNATDGAYARLGGKGAADFAYGSWRVSKLGEYCTEIAPLAGWTCSLIKRDPAGRLLLLASINGQSIGKVMGTLDIRPGNARNLTIPRPSDVLTARDVRDRMEGNTENSKSTQDDDATYTANFKPSGQLVAIIAGRIATGRWTVLQDGRRCILMGEGEETPWACTWLRADGKRYQALGDDGVVKAVVEILDGNPFLL